MSYTGEDFTDADVGEEEFYGFNFIKDIPAGETIDSVEFFLRSYPNSASDPDAQTRLLGSPIIIGTRAIQKIKIEVGGVRYKLKCIATTATSKPALHSFFNVNSEGGC